MDVDNGDLSWEKILSVLFPPNLKHIEISNLNYHMVSERFLHIITSVSMLSILKSFSFEFFNSRINEEHLMIFAYGIGKMLNLTKVVIKMIKNPEISIECIQNFVLIVFKLTNLKEIDLYIRGVPFRDSALDELKQNLTCIRNIQFVSTNQSMHIFRNLEKDVVLV